MIYKNNLAIDSLGMIIFWRYLLNKYTGNSEPIIMANITRAFNFISSSMIKYKLRKHIQISVSTENHLTPFLYLRSFNELHT